MADAKRDELVRSAQQAAQRRSDAEAALLLAHGLDLAKSGVSLHNGAQVQPADRSEFVRSRLLYDTPFLPIFDDDNDPLVREIFLASSDLCAADDRIRKYDRSQLPLGWRGHRPRGGIKTPRQLRDWAQRQLNDLLKGMLSFPDTDNNSRLPVLVSRTDVSNLRAATLVIDNFDTALAEWQIVPRPHVEPDKPATLDVAERRLKERLRWLDEKLVKQAPPADSSDSAGEKADSDRDAKMALLPKSKRAAYLAFQFAESKAGKELSDPDAHAWLKENGIDEYTLPGQETFACYLRKARQALGEQKNTPRGGRTGRSIAQADQL